MQIRAERTGDEAAIAHVVTAAFSRADNGLGYEATIVSRLREAEALTLSLVAESKGSIVGHAAWSPVLVAGKDVGWVGLGPLAADPARRGEGIGAALVREGLERLQTAGVGGCTVLGAPEFYQRFGFAVRDGLTYAGAPPEYFTAIRFAGDWPSGEVTYHPAFEREG